MPSTSPLIVTGMHRSGTSLAAALLRDAGLSIGERLLDLGGDPSRGHSEDLDFVELHQHVLADNGLSTAGWTVEQDIHWSRARSRQAEALVARRAALGAWGWKDPRTVLMLRFWLRSLPEARLLLMFRSPWAVADSLFRRGDFELFWRPTLAVRIWLHYNSLLLDVVDREPERCLLMSADRLVADPTRLIALVRTRFGLDLRPPLPGIVDRTLFKPDNPHQDRLWAIGRLFPDALAVYERLNQAAGLDLPLGDIPTGPTDPKSDPHAVFEQWVSDCRAARGRVPIGDIAQAGSRR